MNIIKVYYLIDFENVGCEGLNGCEKLGESDYIHLFYTNNVKDKMKYSEQIMPGKMYTKYIISLLKEATIELNEEEILDPITFPNAISLSPLRAATIEVTNSGNEVPTATIVKPTKLWLIPQAKAMFEALSTTKSPPITIPTIPIIDKRILFGNG